MKYQMASFNFFNKFSKTSNRVAKVIGDISRSGLVAVIPDYFNKPRSLMKNTLIGLDINPAYVALAEISMNNTDEFDAGSDCNASSDGIDCCFYELMSFTFIPLADFECNHSEAEIMQQAIVLALAKSKPKTRKTVVALPYSMVNDKTVVLTHHSRENTIEEFLKLNSEKYFGAESASINFDYCVLPGAVAATEVFDQSRSLMWFRSQTDESLADIAPRTLALQLITTERKHIDRCEHLLTAVDLNLIAVDVDIYALIRAAVLLYPELKTPYAIVYLDCGKILVALRVLTEWKHFEKLEQPPFFIRETLIDDAAKLNGITLAQFILKQLLQAIQETTVSFDKNSAMLTVLLCGAYEFIVTGLTDLAHIVDEMVRSNRSNAIAMESTSDLKIQVIVANPFNRIKLATHLQPYANELNKIAPVMMLCCGLALQKLYV